MLTIKQVHGVQGYYLEINIVKFLPTFSLHLGITVPQHETYILNRSDILDIGNKNIVSYRIKFMPTIHSPIINHMPRSQLEFNSLSLYNKSKY
jgi:hypothetical protein